jgi:hypothetical protein
MKNLSMKRGSRLAFVFLIATIFIIVSGCGTTDKTSQKIDEKGKETTAINKTQSDETSAESTKDTNGTGAEDAASASTKDESSAAAAATAENTAKDDSSTGDDTKKTDQSKSAGTTTKSTESNTSNTNESSTAKEQTNGSEAIALTPWTSTAATIGESAPKLSGYVIYGRVTDESGQPLTQGVVAIEQGKVHNNAFKYGGVIYPDGTYAIQVSALGDYGVHIYVDGYIYQPGQVTIDASKKAEFNSALVKQPEGYNAPSISNPKMNLQDGKIRITLDANDKKEDLSPQVLAINITTGQTFRLLPPSKPLPEIPGKRFAVYPNGTYSINVALKNGGKGQWIFVAANHRCAISDILRLSVGQ